MGILKLIRSLIRNPNLYIIAAVGTIPGALTGGLIGALSGTYIAPLLGVFSGYKDHKFGLDVDCLAGGIVGLIVGIMVGGILTGGVSIFKMNKNKQQLHAISQENITEILFPALGISMELSVGMAIGAVIGSLKLLGFGTVLGALFGLILMLVTSPIVKRKG